MSKGPEAVDKGPKKEWVNLNKEERAKLESLREPALSILETLGPELLEQKAVTGIVAIDVSGRPCGILIHEIAELVQDKNVPLHFLPGRSIDLEAKIKRMRLPKEGTILLVDDTYAYGTSLDPIEAELRALGYMVRVVAFYNSERRLLLKHPDAFYGVQDEGSEIHKTPTISGVQNQGKPYATVLRSVQGIPPKRFAKKISESRATIKTLASEIVDAYRKQKTAS